jgi:ABC-2 type transport system permease protein
MLSRPSTQVNAPRGHSSRDSPPRSAILSLGPLTDRESNLEQTLARTHSSRQYSLILLRAIVSTDFRLRYQASVLGYLWTLLRPLAVFTILYVVFLKLLKIGAGMPYAAISLLFGIVIWNFFSEVTVQGQGSLLAKADLLRKISFPRYVIVVAVGVSALITMGLSMIVIVLFMAIARVPVRVDMLWLPLLFLELTAVALSLALFLSAVYIRFRDMSYIWEVILQAAFYGTPIIYPLQLIASNNRGIAKIILISPIAQVIQDARYCLLTDRTMTMTQLYGTPWIRLVPIGITVLMLWGSLLFFRRRAPFFAEEA